MADDPVLPDDDVDVTLQWPTANGDADPAVAKAPIPAAPPPPPVPPIPAGASPDEVLEARLAAIDARLGAIGTAVAALGSSVGERLDAHADAAAVTARRVDEVLDEQQRSNRAAADDLRRQVEQVEAVLRRVGSRLDDLAGDLGAVLDAVSADLPPRVDGAAEPPDLRRLRETLGDVKALVEVVVDAMPESEEGTGPGMERRIADAVLARLDLDMLARRLAERLPKP